MKKNNENEEKILISFKNNIKMHLTLKDKSWRNGYVKEVSADFFIFVDDVNGEEPIFFMDLIGVEPFRGGKLKGGRK